MNYEYDYGYGYQTLPSTVMDEEAVMAVLLVILGILAVVLLIALVCWILRSIGLYSIAKRRGIAHAWLSWIPIGSEWILGSVSDQYQHLVEGKVKSRRKILLVLNLVGLSVGITSAILSFVLEFAAYNDGALMAGTVVSMILSLVSVVTGVAYLIFYHMCNYDLYRSCDPTNAVVFLILGIIFGVTEPFFYFFNRKKDLGMVRPEPVKPVTAANAVYETAECFTPAEPVDTIYEVPAETQQYDSQQ